MEYAEDDDDVNDAREELDAPEVEGRIEVDAEDLENRSVHCGCMAGPKFPSINDCQVFVFQIRTFNLKNYKNKFNKKMWYKKTLAWDGHI